MMAHESQDRSWPKSLRNSAKKKLKKRRVGGTWIRTKLPSWVRPIYEPSLFSCFCIVVAIAVIVAMVALFGYRYPCFFCSWFHINKETLFSLLSVYAAVIFALLIFIIGSRQGLLGTMRVVALLRASYIFPVASTVVLLAACYFLLSSFALDAPLTSYVTLAVLVSLGFFIFWSIYRTVRTVMDPGEFKKMLEGVIFDRFRKLQKDYELRALASVEMRSFAEAYDDVIQVCDSDYDLKYRKNPFYENLRTFLGSSNGNLLYMPIEDVNLDALSRLLKKLSDFLNKKMEEGEGGEKNKIVWVGGLDDSFGEGGTHLYIPQCFIEEANLSLDDLIEGKNRVFEFKRKQCESFNIQWGNLFFELEEGLMSSMKNCNLLDFKFCLVLYNSILKEIQDQRGNLAESLGFQAKFPPVLDFKRCLITSIGSKDVSIFEALHEWICKICAVPDKKIKISDLDTLLRRDNWSAVLRAGFESKDSDVS